MFFEDNKKRKVIPRWVPFALATDMGINQSLTISKNPYDVHYLNKLNDWKNVNNSVNAADLISSSFQFIDYENSDVIDASHFLLKNSKSLLVKNMSMRVLNKGKISTESINFLAEEPSRQIRAIKVTLKNHPKNPMGWVDLAYYYTLIGSMDKALKSIEIALSLAPYNRHILRAASKFFLHINDPERANYYSDKSLRNILDPWVLAANIAVRDSFEIKQLFLKQAKNILEEKSFTSNHLSELASSMGTIELEHGAVKKGKNYFKLSLEAPTENSFSQTYHFNKILKLEIDQIRPLLVNNFEADAKFYFFTQRYNDAITELWNWLHFDPFASDPAIQGAFVCSVVLDDFKMAIRFAEMGLKTNPDNFLLLNNYAFALINADEVTKAIRVIGKLEMLAVTDHDIAVLKATSGLLNFRTGKIEQGRILYNEAILSFKKIGDMRSETIALFFLSLEENRSNNLDFFSRIKSIISVIAKKNNYKELLFAIENFEEKNKK